MALRVFPLFFLIFAVPLSAQTVIRSIGVEGNRFFSQRSIGEALPLTDGSLFSPSSVDRFSAALTSLYHNEGFYTFRIDSVVTSYDGDSATVRITFHIREGIRTVLRSIVVTGNAAFTASQVLQDFESVTGEPLSVPRIENDIRAVLRMYSRNGYPFARIRADSMVVDPDNEQEVTLVVVIDEGAQVLLDEIRAEGNTVTKTGVIVREAGLQMGELFNDERSDRIHRRLERLQIFSSVSEPQLYVIAPADSSVLRGGLLITVKEGNNNSFDGILGYVPAAGPNSEGYFTGDLFVAFRNLFGTGRKAMVKWKRENELTQEFELQYREPWVYGLPVTVGGTFFQRKQDSSYVKTRIALRGEYSVTEDLIIAGDLSTESVYPAADLQQFTVFESATLSAGAEIVYDTRDDLRNPTSGLLYSTIARQGTKEITGPERFRALITRKQYSILLYAADAELFLSPFARQVVMIALHGRQVTSSGLEESDLFRFGGTLSVRGYREGQFLASRLAWISLEYRFLTGRASSLYAFSDGGYFSRPAEPVRGIVSQERGVYGYGLGTRVETGLGILNLTYALGRGDSFSTGKIHVGIVNEF